MVCFVPFLHYGMCHNSKPFFDADNLLLLFWLFLCCHQVLFMSISYLLSSPNSKPLQRGKMEGRLSKRKVMMAWTKVWVVLFYQTCVFTCLLFLHLLHGLLKISSEWWSASDSRCMSSVFTFTLFPVFRLGRFFQCILFRSWDYTLQNTKTFFDKLCILWGCEQGT